MQNPTMTRDELSLWGVAANPSTPPDVLASLSKATTPNVRWRVAGNPLSQNVTPKVRWRVALNPSTPPDILATLSQDEDIIVRRRVANNPNTPPDILASLSHGDWVICLYVVKNPSSPYGLWVQDWGRTLP